MQRNKHALGILKAEGNQDTPEHPKALLCRQRLCLMSVGISNEQDSYLQLAISPPQPQELN